MLPCLSADTLVAASDHQCSGHSCGCKQSYCHTWPWCSKAYYGMRYACRPPQCAAIQAQNRNCKA